MRKLLLFVALFTAATSCWLLAMYFVLWHPGYPWRTGVAILLTAQSVLTVAAVNGYLSRTWVRLVLAIAGLGILYEGASAMRSMLFRPHSEGYAVVIALALVVQAALAVAQSNRRRSRASGPAPHRPAAPFEPVAGRVAPKSS